MVPIVLGLVYCEEVPSIERRSVSLHDDIILNPFSLEAFTSNSATNLVSELMNETVENEDLRTLCLVAGLISTRTSIQRKLCWRTLYNLYDNMKSIDRKKGLNFPFDSDLTSFTYSCNSRLILVLAARHGLNKKNKISQILKNYIA